MTKFIWQGKELVTAGDVADAAIEVAEKTPSWASAFMAAYATYIALNKPEYGMDAVRIAHENLEAMVSQISENSFIYYRQTFQSAWAVAEMIKEN